jgi:ribosomal protein S25
MIKKRKKVEIEGAPRNEKDKKEVHHRDAEFAEIGVFLDQELFTLCPQRLCGEFS